jgi:hypothetical protein
MLEVVKIVKARLSRRERPNIYPSAYLVVLDNSVA